jgi:peptide-methionine (R)-S-oxide reductase
MATDDKTKSEDEWRAVLNKEQFRILRQKGTEPGDRPYISMNLY